MTIEQQRAEFEAWYLKNIDEIMSSSMDHWLAWQAAIASVSAQPVELTDEEIILAINMYQFLNVNNQPVTIPFARAVLAAQRAKAKPL